MELNSYIEYTNLHSNINRKDVNKLIDTCIKYKFYGLCLSPAWIAYARNSLDRRQVNAIKLITVPNWVLGGGLANCSGVADSVYHITDEIDYIWNIYNYSDLKDWEKVANELKIIREKTQGKILKIIIESYYLRKADETLYKVGLSTILKEACRLVIESNADFIKTDSGLFKRPDFDSLVEEVKLVKKYVKNLPIKAAGGINTRAQCEKLIDLGVSRIGTSKALEIMAEG